MFDFRGWLKRIVTLPARQTRGLSKVFGKGAGETINALDTAVVETAAAPVANVIDQVEAVIPDTEGSQP